MSDDLSKIRPIVALLPEPRASTGYRYNCPVCGGWIVPKKGTRLSCHIACLYSDDDQAKIADYPATQKSKAKALGITEHAVKVITRLVQRRRMGLHPFDAQEGRWQGS